MPALKCFVSEITIHHTNTQRSLAMSALELGIGLGCAAGPLIGCMYTPVYGSRAMRHRN